MKIEICADSLLSARNAEIAGVSRIELCAAIQSGGITPSFGMIQKVLQEVKLPINVLVRPRPGNFVYSLEEFNMMLSDIKEYKKMNINGIVSGVLLKNGRVDIEKTKKIIETVYPLEFTFHRAIDNSADYFSDIEVLINIGAKKVLTSGNSANVTEGFDTLQKIQNIFGEKICIMPGGGVNEDNIRRFAKIGFSEIHLTASNFVIDDCYNNEKLSGMGHFTENGKIGYKYSDIKRINNVKMKVEYYFKTDKNIKQ